MSRLIWGWFRSPSPKYARGIFKMDSARVDSLHWSVHT